MRHRLNLKYGLAEQYKVNPEDNRFFFLNPFSHLVFQKVVENILRSVEESPRSVDIILYYPLPEYKEILQDYGMRMINKVTIPDSTDAHGKFVIYRFSPPNI